MSRISPSTVLLGVFAVLFGLGGAHLVQQQLRQQPTPEPEPVPVVEAPQMVLVPLASMDLKSGREITLGDIAIHQMTREQLKERGIAGGYMLNTDQIIGRVLKEDLAKDQAFYTTGFFPEGTGPSIADDLEPGQRAVTVPVLMDAAVAGFAGPGERVDVIFRSQAQENGAPESTITLLEDVRVLALDRETFEGSQAPGQVAASRKPVQVTLAVSPEQAVKLQVVQHHGELSLALRHPEDGTTYTGVAPQTLNELLGWRPEPPKKQTRMEVYRGRRVTTVVFDEDQGNTRRDEYVAPGGNPATPVAQGGSGTPVSVDPDQDQLP